MDIEIDIDIDIYTNIYIYTQCMYYLRLTTAWIIIMITGATSKLF